MRKKFLSIIVIGAILSSIAAPSFAITGVVPLPDSSSDSADSSFCPTSSLPGSVINPISVSFDPMADVASSLIDPDDSDEVVKDLMLQLNSVLNESNNKKIIGRLSQYLKIRDAITIDPLYQELDFDKKFLRVYSSFMPKFGKDLMNPSLNIDQRSRINHALAILNTIVNNIAPEEPLPEYQEIMSGPEFLNYLEQLSQKVMEVYKDKTITKYQKGRIDLALLFLNTSVEDDGHCNVDEDIIKNLTTICNNLCADSAPAAQPSSFHLNKKKLSPLKTAAILYVIFDVVSKNVVDGNFGFAKSYAKDSADALKDRVTCAEDSNEKLCDLKKKAAAVAGYAKGFASSEACILSNGLLCSQSVTDSHHKYDLDRLTLEN